MRRGRVGLAVLMVAAVALPACGERSEEEAGPASDTGSTSVVTFGVTEERGGALPTAFAQWAEGRIAGGTTYQTRNLSPELTVTVPSTLYGVDAPGVLFFISDIENPVFPDEAYFAMALNGWMVYDDPLLPEEEFYANEAAHHRPLPADVYGWLADNPWLEVTEGHDVSVGGFPAVAFEVSTVELPTEPVVCSGGPNCVLLFANPRDAEFAFVLAEGLRIRLYLIRHDSGPILVGGGGPTANWDRLSGSVEQFISSVEIR